MNIINMALVTAVITVAVLIISKILHNQPIGKVFASTVPHFCASFLVYAGLLYFFSPALTGLAGGYGFLITTALFYLAGTGMTDKYSNNEQRTASASFALPLLCGIAFIAWLAINIVTYWCVTLGTDNVQRFARLANVKIASPKDKLPPTDPDHIVMVTQQAAAFMGQQAIGDSSNNLGSIYNLDPLSYTLQSVDGHLYWLAPLVYRNPLATQFGIFSTKIETSPGFVSVDAENPNGEVKLHTGCKMRYMPCALFNQDLARHIYLNGFQHGELDDITFEVDDKWHPYFTAAYVRPAFGGVAGKVIDKLILVDGETGNVQAIEPTKVPMWIDRVMSQTLVKEYVTDWGIWGDKRSSGIWPNFGMQYQTKPVDYELLYNSLDKPVWVIPMTSNNSTNASSTGVMIYDTHDNNAIFYPGLSGLGTGDNVKHAFENSPKNVTHRTVDSVQLYQVNGVPTQVAIYTQPQGDHGASFAAIGLLEARHLNGANVIFAEDKRTALADYANALATGDGNTADISRIGQFSKTITGTITRMGSQMVNQQTTYIMIISGDKHRFTANARTSELLPLMREGDTVTLKYLDTQEETEAIVQIEDASIPKATIKK